MLDPWICVQDLCYSYKDESTGHPVDVLRGINLNIYRGEYIAIIGHNGSGKSTFAKILNLVREATSGHVFVDGKDITSPDLTDEDIFSLRQKIGMVFQNPDNQLVATVVEEDVAFGPENLGIPSEEIRKRVDEALSIVGMSDYAKHEPHRLSGGQKQRVAIAGIIAMLPECMIFDESTAMLDPLGRSEVLETMEMLHREKGITILTITHHMDEAARANRIIVLDDGRILRDGTPEEIFSEPEILLKAGLDVPQSAALVHKLRKSGWEIPGLVGAPGACVESLVNAYHKLCQNKHL